MHDEVLNCVLGCYDMTSQQVMQFSGISRLRVCNKLSLGTILLNEVPCPVTFQ